MTKHKSFSFINLAGLAIGLACTIFIMLWVQDELSYDKFHDHKNELYRIVRTNEKESFHTYNVPGALAEALKSDYPEIVNATSYCKLPATKLSNRDRGFYSDLRYVDPAFFQMFTYPLKSGTYFTETSNPLSIVISEDLALKLFGEENAVGKAITMDDSQELSIVGVMKNNPTHSHIQFDGLLPFQLAPESAHVWTNNWPYTYIQLNKQASHTAVSEKISRVLQQYKQNSKERISLQPLVDTHLHSYHGSSRMTYVYIFSALGIVVLFTACINFINLFTAYSDRRAKEISIKKVVGSSQKQLIAQFLSETIMYVIIAMNMAMIMVQLALPHLNALTGKQLDMTFSLQTVFMFLGMILITGLAAGFYPALTLSSQQPISALRTRGSKSFKQSYLRKALIVIQFVFSVFLIVSVLVITRQMNYLQNKNLGFNKEHVLVLNTRGKLSANSEVIRNELLKNPSIEQVAVSINPMERRKSDGLLQYGINKKINAAFNYVDCNFQQTMQIQMAYGRFFSEEIQSELNGAVINESAMHALGLEDPIGKSIVRSQDSAYPGPFTIIGVTKDFHSESLHHNIRPLMFMHSRQGNFMYLRVRPNNLLATIDYIRQTITKLIPNEPFTYQFLDETIGALYNSEQVMSRLTLYVTFLAIFVSALGLLGLVALTIAQRTKEIGVRKILGSSTTNVMTLLTKDYLKLVLIANIIAWPLSYFILNKWMENFAFHINISWWIFALASGLVFMIAVGTVIWQVIRAATANPVEALKYE